MELDESFRRVRFYGTHDLAAGAHMDRVTEVIEKFKVNDTLTSAKDAIELHNVQKYIDNGLFPSAFTEEDRTNAVNLARKMNSAIARFFNTVNDANCASIVTDIDYEYRDDLLDLLGRNKAYDRCSPDVMLSALGNAGIHIGQLLACAKLVSAYPAEVHKKLLSSSENAEHLIRKYLEAGTSVKVHLPTSITPKEVRDLLESYIASPEANLNYMRLIETAPSESEQTTGIDNKLRLQAQHRGAELTEQLFENSRGYKTGVAVNISADQDDPVVVEIDDSDGISARFTYSNSWLEQTLEYPSILNNFLHLFEFADLQAVLTLPSYPAQLSVFERMLGATGVKDYRTGVAFRSKEHLTLLQTGFYLHYLKGRGIDLEDVIAWFFNEYLAEEFNVQNFSFTRSSREATYLEKIRHLFAELDGVVRQFALFVEEGELDPELLSIDSKPVRYREVPSLVAGKYIYQSPGNEISGIVHALFSDQSGLRSVRDGLSGDNFAELIVNNNVLYGDLHEFQKSTVDRLVSLGIVERLNEQLCIANLQQLRILKSLFATEAVNYFHLSAAGRAEVGAMEEKGWVSRRSSLLTEAESAYFNYVLNLVDSSNGPQVRNKYVHGAQANGRGEAPHFDTYITVLKLTIALIIKVNDDFCLADEEQSAVG